MRLQAAVLYMPAATSCELPCGPSPALPPTRTRAPAPTPAAVRAGWTGTVHREAPTVTGVGLEKMTIEFAWSRVGEHFTGGAYHVNWSRPLTRSLPRRCLYAARRRRASRLPPHALASSAAHRLEPPAPCAADRGYNAVSFERVYDSWVDQVRSRHGAIATGSLCRAGLRLE